jgi:hypothetical protein
MFMRVLEVFNANVKNSLGTKNIKRSNRMDIKTLRNVVDARETLNVKRQGGN